jgi:sugar phosphate isomerase/epimerase
MQVAVHAKLDGYNNIDEVLWHYQSLGFKALEMDCPWRFFSNLDPERVKALLNQRGLEIRFHIIPLDIGSFVQQDIYEKERLEIETAISLGSEMGADQVSIHPPYFSSSQIEEKLRQSGTLLYRQLTVAGADKAYSKGMKFSIESFCYKPFIFYSPQDFKEFLNGVPLLGTILETGHLFQIGFDLSEMISLFSNRIYDVHIHDATREKDFRKATHLPLGKGLIDFQKLLRDLANVKYDGWLTLEIKPHTDSNALIKSRRMLENFVSHQ